MSLETPVGDENSTLEDMIRDTSEWAPDEAAMRILTREDVIQALEDLPPRLRLLLALRFGFFDDRPRTLEEVGEELGVTRERVRQLERQALDRLRQSGRLPTLEDVEVQRLVGGRLYHNPATIWTIPTAPVLLSTRTAGCVSAGPSPQPMAAARVESDSARGTPRDLTKRRSR